MKPELDPEADSSTLEDDAAWQMWGPYMSNREWGTVRETEGPEGYNWTKLPYDRAAGTASRFCEDGIFGVCDRECRICHAYAFWNYRDDHLKERFFGVANEQGQHGEDVKEMYHYRAADPQYRYICAEYLYPQTEYPYKHLVDMESRLKQAASDAKQDCGASAVVSLTDFNNWHRDSKYFEIEFEMSKLSPEQLYFQLSITNCSSEDARVVAMPMLFLRNTWSPGWQTGEDARVTKVIRAGDNHLVVCLTDADGNETNFGYFYDSEAGMPEVLLTHNCTRVADAPRQHCKDSFGRYIVAGDGSELIANLGDNSATKAGICYRLKLAPKQQVKLRSFLMLQRSGESVLLNWRGLTASMEMVRLQNLVDTYQAMPISLVPAEQDILNAAYTALLWNRQYYPLDRMPHLWQVPGDLPTRLVTVPDKWEQPYLATWDAALHCLCLNCFDRRQALRELMLLMALIRQDGSVYSDEYRPHGVTPPLIVLAAIDVYGKCTPKEQSSLGPHIYVCLKSHLHWWLHRKDARGVALIDGGVCGVDYVSLFPREFVETGEGLIWAIFFIMRFLELSLAIHQSCLDAAAAATVEQDLPLLIFYLGRLCATFVQTVAQENGLYHPCWLDVAVAAASSSSNNSNSDSDSEDSLAGAGGHRNSRTSFTSVASMDGSQVSFSGVVGDDYGGGLGIGGRVRAGDRLPEGRQRCCWLHAYCYLPAVCCCSLPNIKLRQRPESSEASAETLEDLFAATFNGPSDWETRAPYIYTDRDHSRLFVSALNSLQLAELLEQVLSEVQFLSQYGIRTMSLLHTCDDASVRVTRAASAGSSVGSSQRLVLRQKFCPGASSGGAYGGNTNWYGAVNLPYNYLMLESLHKWATVLDRKFDLIEYPSYTGRYRRLKDIVQDLASRNVALFLPNASGIFPCTGDDAKRGLPMCETFDGDTGRGHGASHKGGWSAIIARILLLMHGVE